MAPVKLKDAKAGLVLVWPEMVKTPVEPVLALVMAVVAALLTKFVMVAAWVPE